MAYGPDHLLVTNFQIYLLSSLWIENNVLLNDPPNLPNNGPPQKSPSYPRRPLLHQLSSLSSLFLFSLEPLKAKKSYASSIPKRQVKTLVYDELSKRKKRGNWKMKHLHQNVCLNGIFIVKKELKGDRKDSSSRRQSGLKIV